MYGPDKTLYDTEWKTYRERQAKLTEHRGKVFSIILGQCHKDLKNNMEVASNYTAVMKSNTPLPLLDLIEQTVQTTIEDRYPFEVTYENDIGLLGFQQNTLTHNDWFDKFQTRVSVTQGLGMSRHHPFLLDHVANEIYKKDYDSLTNDDETTEVETKAEECYLAYIMLRNSCAGSNDCLLYTSPSPRDQRGSRMPSSA